MDKENAGVYNESTMAVATLLNDKEMYTICRLKNITTHRCPGN